MKADSLRVIELRKSLEAKRSQRLSKSSSKGSKLKKTIVIKTLRVPKKRVVRKNSENLLQKEKNLKERELQNI
jgi:hypothetical protein